jgi:hypothetical protein
MHKKTRKGEIMPKTREKSLTRSQKRDFWWGRVKMRRPGAFIVPVGSPSGRLINPIRTRAASKTCRQVARVRKSNLIVRQLEPCPSGWIGVPSGRLSYTRPDAERGCPDASH